MSTITLINVREINIIFPSGTHCLAMPSQSSNRYIMTNACCEINGDCANCKVCTALLDLRLLSHVTSHVAAKSILTLRQSAERELTLSELLMNTEMLDAYNFLLS